MTNEPQIIHKEIQTIMHRSRVLLEEMTILLHWHSPELNRRRDEDRRSGFDRRLCADRRAEARRNNANPPLPNQDNRRDAEIRNVASLDAESRDAAGRRTSDRRLLQRNRRAPLVSRQQIIEAEMEFLAERNLWLQQRLAWLNTQQPQAAIPN